MARVSLDTLIDRSVKTMGTGMNPVVKESAIELIRQAYAEGINVQISSGYRSFADQDKLYLQGRRGIAGEPKVTNARGGESNHNFGLAIDYFLVSENGQIGLWTVNKEWRRVAAIGKSLGFSWGGDWKSFVDNPHLEMTGGLSLAQLRAGKRPNLVSKVKPPAPPKNDEKEVDHLSAFLEKATELTQGQKNTMEKLQKVGVVSAKYEPSHLDLHLFSLMGPLVNLNNELEKKVAELEKQLKG